MEKVSQITRTRLVQRYLVFEESMRASQIGCLYVKYRESFYNHIFTVDFRVCTVTGGGEKICV